MTGAELIQEMTQTYLASPLAQAVPEHLRAGLLSNYLAGAIIASAAGFIEKHEYASAIDLIMTGRSALLGLAEASMSYPENQELLRKAMSTEPVEPEPKLEPFKMPESSELAALAENCEHKETVEMCTHCYTVIGEPS